MQDINHLTDGKNWQWEITTGDKLRATLDVQILAKEYHILRVIANKYTITLRVKEQGKQDIEEIELLPNTIVYYKKEDVDMSGLDWLFKGKM